MKRILLAVTAAVLMPVAAQGQITFNALGDTYTQNFDSLVSTNGLSATYVDETTLAGVIVNSEEMDENSDEYFGSDGSSNGGEVYSFGVDGNSDRALGYLGSGGNDFFNVAFRFSNGTGSVIDSLIVGYTGEQWRSGGSTDDNLNSLQFSYQIFSSGAGSVPASTDLTGWTEVNTLDFFAPQTSLAAGSLDGNAAANQTVFSGIEIAGLNLADGDEIWLRFTGDNGAGTDAGLGIDDLSVATVVPEPTSVAMLIGGLGLLAFRRSRRA